VEVLSGENDFLPFDFSASVLGGGQWPNRWFHWQCSPVLPSLSLEFLWAVPRDMPSVSAKETSS